MPFSPSVSVKKRPSPAKRKLGIAANAAFLGKAGVSRNAVADSDYVM